MNITITKGGKDYEFKYSTEKTGIRLNKNDGRILTHHKWTCEELGPEAEVFFGDYDNTQVSIKRIQDGALKGIENLPIIVAMTAKDIQAEQEKREAEQAASESKTEE